MKVANVLAVRGYAAIPIVTIRTATSLTVAIFFRSVSRLCNVVLAAMLDLWTEFVSALQAFRRHVKRNRGLIGPGRGCARPSALVYVHK